MTPSPYDPIVRGCTASIGLQFMQQDLFTREVSFVDLGGAVVTLEMTTADGALSSWASPTDLSVDLRLAIAVRDLTPEQTSALPLGVALVRWRVQYPDKRVEQFLAATIEIQD